jgi:hypothetical protein
MSKLERILGDWKSWMAFLALAAPAAPAAIVVLNVDMPLDQVAPDTVGMKIGDHHFARIFYDDTSVDPQTHRAPVIHMQHWMGRWTPELVGDPAMPMADAWLDLGSKPYRYHYRGAAVIGEPILVEFNDRTRRMSISRAREHTVLIAAPYTIDPRPVPHLSLMVMTVPAMTMLHMKVILDEVAAGQPGRVGDVDQIRLLYDATAVDPGNGHVKLNNFQHFINGAYSPAAPDPLMMPMDDSWLDTSTEPYRLHFRAAVVHGLPIIIDVDENLRRLTIHPQQDPGAILESGRYEIDPAPVASPEASENQSR